MTATAATSPSSRNRPARPTAIGVHERYRALEIAVTSVTRYEVVVASN